MSQKKRALLTGLQAFRQCSLVQGGKTVRFMRVKNTLLNSAVAIISYILLALITLLVRKFFTQFLPTELLGYEGLFSNIFSLLALTDLGIQDLIMYRLMSSVGTKNREKTAYYMNIYRQLYKVIGLIVFLIAVILIPFLRYLINNNQYRWSYVYTVYFVQLFVTLCSYFLAYKRMILIVSQQEYRCTRVDTICKGIGGLLKIGMIIIFRSYIGYLLISLFENIISNYIISLMVDREYPELKAKQKIKFEELKENGILTDAKYGFASKLAGTIYGGTDNIVISAFLGLKSVALMSNYLLISNYVSTFVTKLLTPFQAAIGDQVYSSGKKDMDLFFMLDRCSFIIASTICICYITLFNNFIRLWLGPAYVLAESFVIVYALNQYVSFNQQFLLYFRATFGNYQLDKNYIMAGAVLNVVLSILLVKPIGLTGVLIGTLIGNLGFWYGRAHAVRQVYLKNLIGRYMKSQFINLLILAAEIFAVNSVCQLISGGVGGFIIKLFISFLAPVILNSVYLLTSKEGSLAKSYIHNVMGVVKERIHHEKPQQDGDAR